MSDDSPGDRSPKSRPAADAQEMLLPDSLKSALLRELSPTRAERERVQAGIAAALGGGAASSSPTIEQADAEMGARVEQLEAATVAGGTSLTTKVVVSSVLLASAVALTTVVSRQGAVPAPARELQAPAPGADERTLQPTAAEAAKQQAVISTSERASDLAPASSERPKRQSVIATPERASDPAHAEPAADPRPARTRRVRGTGASPAAAPLAPTSDEPSVPVADSGEAPVAIKAAAKPALTLAGELALVRSASAALDRKDAKTALELLARYQRTYPAGSLAIEVQALRAIALCLDQQPQAAAARDAFLREHGKSALAGRVRNGCP